MQAARNYINAGHYRGAERARGHTGAARAGIIMQPRRTWALTSLEPRGRRSTWTRRTRVPPASAPSTRARAIRRGGIRMPNLNSACTWLCLQLLLLLLGRAGIISVAEEDANTPEMTHGLLTEYNRGISPEARWSSRRDALVRRRAGIPGRGGLLGDGRASARPDLNVPGRALRKGRKSCERGWERLIRAVVSHGYGIASTKRARHGKGALRRDELTGLIGAAAVMRLSSVRTSGQLRQEEIHGQKIRRGLLPRRDPAGGGDARLDARRIDRKDDSRDARELRRRLTPVKRSGCAVLRIRVVVIQLGGVPRAPRPAPRAARRTPAAPSCARPRASPGTASPRRRPAARRRSNRSSRRNRACRAGVVRVSSARELRVAHAPGLVDELLAECRHVGADPVVDLRLVGNIPRALSFSIMCRTAPAYDPVLVLVRASGCGRRRRASAARALAPASAVSTCPQPVDLLLCKRHERAVRSWRPPSFAPARNSNFVCCWGGGPSFGNALEYGLQRRPCCCASAVSQRRLFSNSLHPVRLPVRETACSIYFPSKLLADTEYARTMTAIY